MDPLLRGRGRRPGEKGGELTGPSPIDRGKSGSKYHILCDRNGLPLHVLASAANTHDSQLFVPLLETNPGVPHGRGRPRRRPDKLHADKGYDYRLGLRYDRTEATLRPLLTLAASIINLRRLQQTESSSSVTPAA